MISIKNVTKSYSKGTVKAVDDVSLEVKNGEIFGFIGPNGAGKTTTIKMIAGVLPIDSGSIMVNGFDVATSPIQAKQALGLVPDTNEIYDRLTGNEYLNFIADIYGVSQADRSEGMNKYLQMFEIKDAAKELIRSYSHGMKQKLILAGALLHSPSLWILDEPMTGLDPKSAHLLKQEMRSHCDKGNTVFFSTHVLEVAEKICNRLAIIKSGKIVAVGSMEELRQKSGESLENIFLDLTE